MPLKCMQWSVDMKCDRGQRERERVKAVVKELWQKEMYKSDIWATGFFEGFCKTVGKLWESRNDLWFMSILCFSPKC